MKFFVPIRIGGPVGGAVARRVDGVSSSVAAARGQARADQASAASTARARRTPAIMRPLRTRGRARRRRGARRRQGEVRRRCPRRGRSDPDPPAELVDDPLADGQADAGAGIVLLAVQALEGLEDAPRVVGVHADPVVAHREAPDAVVALGLDAHVWSPLPCELHRVADEVLKDAAEVRTIGAHDGQVADRHLRAALLDRPRELLERLLDDAAGGTSSTLEVPATGARVLQQVADQGRAPAGSRRGSRRRGRDRRRPRCAAAALEQLGVHRDRRQRRLQVVRRDRRELLELGVGARQLGV